MANENPKISIIMPSLNVAEYIEECIESVANQTLKDIEIICIDAGSTDGTLEILKQYANNDSRITLMHSDKKSYGYQMNQAIGTAKGEYIGIVETDDYIAENMFEKLYSLSKGKMDIVKSNFYHVEENGKIRKDGGKKNLIRESKAFTINDCPAIIKAHPSIWAGIYRKEFLDENDIKFIEEEGGGWVDNPFFYETAFAASSIAYTDEAYYYYREFNPTSSSNNLQDYTIPIKRMLDNLDVVDKYETNDEILKMVYMRAFAYLRNIQRRQYFEENLPEVRPLLCEMMKRMDENYIKTKSDFNTKIEYYKYLSPLRLTEEFTHNQYEDLLKENDFLYESISHLQNQNRKLKSKSENGQKTNSQSSIKNKLKKLF